MKIQFGKAFLRGLQLAIARKIARPTISTSDNLRQTVLDVGMERVGDRFAQQQQGLPHDEAFTQAIAEYRGK
ncbi:MAG: hypothetical protein F6K04_01400 [Leptolyngbya sp. SIO4C5]|nr:hypothetical protein [Leptolyngbya sp. SIO4C5]